MKTQIRLAVTALILSAINSQLSTAHAQGSLTPPGAPAPTMKSLAQIEPRTPISSAPFTISMPGSYYLTTNLTTAVSNAVIIAVSGVTLDLNGFTISSTVTSAANGGAGILIGGGLRNLTIQNGFIQGGVTNNGSDTYSGSGFRHGIYYSGAPSPVNTRVSGVSVSGCLTYGIYLNIGDPSLVESCTVSTVGNNGIRASTIKNSAAVDCGGSAIFGDQVSDCRGKSSSGGYGVFATVAQNCYGFSDGTGVFATTAQNCNGYSTGPGGFGLYATASATGCYGYSTSGTGLYAYIANVCRGQTASGTALTTPHNVNSY